jgi:hypothetical protein
MISVPRQRRFERYDWTVHALGEFLSLLHICWILM